MRLGILECGRLSDEIAARHGVYPELYGALYRAVEPAVEVEAVPVVDGVLPESPTACDAWLVTGSKHGVYDPLPWIEPLKGFLREARAARVPLIGICFGHQLMAEAFGGRAEKSVRGWGCGVHRYRVVVRPGWVGDAVADFAMAAMHQDQVTALPDDATLLAASDFCPVAMVAYGDAEAPDAISIQPHPEFGTELARDLVDLRTTTSIPEAVAATARESFTVPPEGEVFARWSLAYLRDALARRRAA